MPSLVTKPIAVAIKVQITVGAVVIKYTLAVNEKDPVDYGG